MGLIALPIMFLFCASLSAIIEAELFNRLKVKRIDGKEKFSDLEFLISNIAFAFVFVVIFSILFTLYFGPISIILALFVCILLNVTVESWGLRDVVEKEDSFFVPFISKIISIVITALIFYVLYIVFNGVR